MRSIRKRELVKEVDYKSQFTKDSEEEARRTINDIRLLYPVSDGWIEVESHVEEVLPGKYVAVAKYEQYK